MLRLILIFFCEFHIATLTKHASAKFLPILPQYLIEQLYVTHIIGKVVFRTTCILE